MSRYAIATGRGERDPSRDLSGALAPIQERHFASITEPLAVGELLRAIDAYKGAFVTRCALRLAPLVFVRPGELRTAQWAEFDFEKSEWRIPATRMKSRVQHIVPLSTPASGCEDGAKNCPDARHPNLYRRGYGKIVAKGP